MSDHPSLSTYSYCSNNPLIRIDLFGLDDIYYKSGSTVHNPEVVKTDEPDRYFIEHDEGNVDVNAKAVSGNTISGQFFEVNSFQTISKYFEEKGENSTYDPKDVDVNWEKEGYPERFNEAIPGFFDPTPSAIYAGIQSLPGKNMDQKKNLQGDKIYIFGKIGYNFQEAGNIVWGAAMNYLHFGLSPSLNLANKFTRYSQGRDDQPNEQEAIIVGWEHFQKSGKNRRLFW
jgi:hypothetical protein